LCGSSQEGWVARRHDHDAGGDPGLLAAKAALRDQVWGALEAANVTRFPGARNRISNFAGAEDAADRLRDTAAWQAARTIKAESPVQTA
jgi:5-formyltetrahydrofolate cyclo-ligase